MSVFLAAPQRLALMMRDSNPNIVEAYYLYVDNLDYIKRPSYIIAAGSASYSINDSTTVSQASVEEDYEIYYVGEPFKSTEEDFGNVFELQTRQAAFDAIVYLLRHPNLQFSDTRGLYGKPLPNLRGVFWARPQSRSPVAIMTREGIEEPFWGFSISLSLKTMLSVDEDEVIIVT